MWSLTRPLSVGQELGRLERQNRQLRALSTRWQLRAEASEKGWQQAAQALREERARRLEVSRQLAACAYRNVVIANVISPRTAAYRYL